MGTYAQITIGCKLDFFLNEGRHLFLSYVTSHSMAMLPSYSYSYSFGLEDLTPLASCTPRRAMPELFNMGFIDTKKVSRHVIL